MMKNRPAWNTGFQRGHLAGPGAGGYCASVPVCGCVGAGMPFIFEKQLSRGLGDSRIGYWVTLLLRCSFAAPSLLLRCSFAAPSLFLRCSFAALWTGLWTRLWTGLWTRLWTRLWTGLWTRFWTGLWTSLVMIIGPGGLDWRSADCCPPRAWRSGSVRDRALDKPRDGYWARRLGLAIGGLLSAWSLEEWVGSGQGSGQAS